MAERNYYEVLGVSKSATDAEIQDHYLQKMHEVHPDRNPGDEDRAMDRTIEVVNAYRTLSDPQARRLYDFRCAHPFLMQGETPGQRVLMSKERKEAEALFAEGVALLKAEEFHKAGEKFKAALKAEASYAAAAWNLALLGARLGNPAFSVDLLGKTLQANPKDGALTKLRSAILKTFLSAS